MVESFKQYSHEKLKKEEKIQFEGGEIVFKKSVPVSFNAKIQQKIKYIEAEELKDKAVRLFGEKIAEAKYLLSDNSNKLNQKNPIKVMFVTDKKREEAVDSTDSYEKQLKVFFSDEVTVLFSKMIKAMKLELSDFMLGFCSTKNEELEFLYQEILYFRPEFVIPLGANSSSIILDMKERLSNIHGQFFKRILNQEKINEFHFTICPLFNPEFLLINPNMKKTAWTDMQKVMKELGH